MRANQPGHAGRLRTMLVLGSGGAAMDEVPFEGECWQSVATGNSVEHSPSGGVVFDSVSDSWLSIKRDLSLDLVPQLYLHFPIRSSLPLLG
jgi:hypothetical protein